MYEIEEIYKMLSWENPVEMRLRGIKLAREITDLSLLIMPPSVPSVWEQCANILAEKSDNELEPYLENLLEWMQDLNWPGSITIEKRLKAFSWEKIKPPLEKAVAKSITLPEREKSMWLYYLSGFLDNKILAANLSDDVLILLRRQLQ